MHRPSPHVASRPHRSMPSQSVVRHAVECMGVILQIALASKEYWQEEPTAKAHLDAE
jgi:hypothetical protein